MATNLTGTPSVWGDLNMATQNQQDLSDEEELARKKKLLAAGTNSDLQTATQMLFGSKLNAMGTPRA